MDNLSYSFYWFNILKTTGEEKNISQSELARLLSVHHSIIGKYERDEVKPSIDVVKNIAAALDTTVGYLLGEQKTGCA